MIINTIASIWGDNMLGYLSLDIICSSKLTVFLELRSRKTVRFSEQIMSADKYPSIFSRQMEAIVYIIPNFQKCALCEKDFKDNKHNSFHLGQKYALFLFEDIICSEKRTVFRELSFRKTVRFSEQIMSSHKNPSIFPRQIRCKKCIMPKGKNELIFIKDKGILEQVQTL